tara:strand:+ start:1161 stop:1976 length:816 start_codon:yes stop_codon:yes gene_type:complete
MSLREQHKKQQSKFNPAPFLMKGGIKTEDKMILNVEELKSIIVSELTKRITTADPEKLKNCRKQIKEQPWRLCNMLNVVSKPRFIYMIDSFVSNFIEEITVIQNNGTWQVHKFEVSVEPSEQKKWRQTGAKDEFGSQLMEPYVKSDDYLYVTVEFVDIKGGSDWIYHNGKTTGLTKRERGIPEDQDPGSYRADLVPPSKEQDDIIAKQANALEEEKKSRLKEKKAHDAKLIEQDKKIAEQSAQMAKMMKMFEKQNSLLEASLAPEPKQKKK